MKLLALVLVGFVTARVNEIICTHTEEEYWTAWKEFLKIPEVQERSKMYLNKLQHDLRFAVFKENLEKITAHNDANLPWKMGVNQFTDMTATEFRKYSSCVTGNTKKKPRVSEFNAPTDWNKTGTNSVDWVAQGDVTSVKNQGSCGSCWAFSTTGVIESRTQIATGNLVSLSEQQLVDCSNQGGCNGGWPDQALYYVYSDDGLCTEAKYRYKAKGGWCWANWCKKDSPIRTYAYVQVSTSAMEAAVNAGPVSIVIDADFQSYQSGVLTSNCGTNFNHAVLLVGYGTDSTTGMAYWKVKNSWGSWWGEDGYVRLCRNCNRNNGLGQCGILKYGVYPIVK